MLRHAILSVLSAVVVFAAAEPRARSGPELRADLPLMASVGTYDIVLQLPSGAAGAPTLPADQACGKIELQIGTTESKTCRVGPVSKTVSIFKPVVNRTVQSLYDAAARTCRARGNIRAGSYEVRARYLTRVGETPATWSPPMTSQIENISGTGRINVTGRQTSTVQVNLTRQHSMSAPQMVNC